VAAQQTDQAGDLPGLLFRGLWSGFGHAARSESLVAVMA
jgi:hypothetical protein